MSKGKSSGSAHMSTAPPSITKVLTPNEIHGGTRYCKLALPTQFCDKHNVPDHVTMANSTGHTLWHMHCQSNLRMKKGIYVISNGWREFAYDHGLKQNDKLVFTLASPSHFVVDFGGCARAMRPTRDAKNGYPWRRHHVGRGANWKNFSECVKPNVASTTDQLAPSALSSKLQALGEGPESSAVCQCESVSGEDSVAYLSELTHIECINPDGTTYLQIIDSDEDEDEVPNAKIDGCNIVSNMQVCFTTGVTFPNQDIECYQAKIDVGSITRSVSVTNVA